MYLTFNQYNQFAKKYTIYSKAFKNLSKFLYLNSTAKNKLIDDCEFPISNCLSLLSCNTVTDLYKCSTCDPLL